MALGKHDCSDAKPEESQTCVSETECRVESGLDFGGPCVTSDDQWSEMLPSDKPDRDSRAPTGQEVLQGGRLS